MCTGLFRLADCLCIAPNTNYPATLVHTVVAYVRPLIEGLQ